MNIRKCWISSTCPGRIHGTGVVDFQQVLLTRLKADQKLRAEDGGPSTGPRRSRSGAYSPPAEPAAEPPRVPGWAPGDAGKVAERITAGAPMSRAISRQSKARARRGAVGGRLEDPERADDPEPRPADRAAELERDQQRPRRSPRRRRSRRPRGFSGRVGAWWASRRVSGGRPPGLVLPRLPGAGPPARPPSLISDARQRIEGWGSPPPPRVGGAGRSGGRARGVRQRMGGAFGVGGPGEIRRRHGPGEGRHRGGWEVAAGDVRAGGHAADAPFVIHRSGGTTRI